MFPVNGRPVFSMESVNDRMRLKDKIITNVSKAVKSIQELKIMAGSGHVTLSNYDWQCHRLCEHLDHTLLHGLRHVTPGYWKIVSEFTHRDCVKEIKRMRNVTTDLGRGRAWLFMALNENLLECYMRCYHQNEELVEDFYVKDALVRDQDRFNLLLTLTAGLENIEFQLECDVPYLDLCVYPPNMKNKSSVEATVEYDKLSICSMESIHPGSQRPLPQTVFEQPERQRSNSQDSGSVGSDDLTTRSRYSPSIDSGVHSDWNYKQRSITPIIEMSNNKKSSSVTSTNSPELEVIRMTKKGKPQKNRKKKRKFLSVSSVTDEDATQDLPENPAADKIEIPPIDDLQLSSAIMKSKDEEQVDGALESDANVLSGKRLPGDGIENAKTKVNNSDNGDSAIIMCSDDQTDRGDELSSSSSKLNDKITDLPAKEDQPKSDGGFFTEMLKARVDDIVNADTSDVVDDKTSNTIYDNENDKTDNNGQQYKNMIRDVKSKVIYNMDDDENAAKFTESTKTNINSVDKQQTLDTDESVIEEPSIYSKAQDSDSFGSDEEENDFYVTANSTKFFQSSERSTPSRQSNTSSPSRSSNNTTPARLTPRNSVQFTSVPNTHSPINDNGNLNECSSETNLTNQFSYDKEPANQESDLSDYDQSSNRNTPDVYGTNQKRPVSASSRSSHYDTEDDSRLPNSRPQSSQSGHRASPNVSIISQSSNHSNQSTDPELQGTEQQALHAKVEELIEQKKLYTRLTFSEDEEEEDINNPTPPPRPRTSSLRAGEVELDNNSMLYLSLDIIQEDAETVIRMFCCRQGHTEGKTKTVFIMLTTHALYILQEQGKRRFQTLVTVPFLEIDFVSVGFHNQTLHIACKNKRQQYWLTSGDERVTVALVDCLAHCMEHSELKPGQLEVDTGSLAQKISLNKYIMKECHCDTDETEVMCYSLVHWEDPSSNTASCESDREGVLYYKSMETTNILGTQTWKLGYAILRDGMLCLYNDKTDTKPSQFLSMNEGQCVGCKRDFNTDKNHSIKIILSDETTWCISLNSEEEANNWLQGLCQAVAEGLQMNPSRSTVIPCCMILSRQKLLMCHEDMETNFVRTLGSACVPDITAVLLDEVNHTFLILAFDSSEENVSDEKWVLYFNSEPECTRFKTALSSCWLNQYQVEVPELPINDFTLEKKSRSMATYLKSTITLK